MASHVTKASVDDLGLPIGEPRFVGCGSCSCGWSWRSEPRADWQRAFMVAELAGAAHRVFEAINGR